MVVLAESQELGAQQWPLRKVKWLPAKFQNSLLDLAVALGLGNLGQLGHRELDRQLRRNLLPRLPSCIGAKCGTKNFVPVDDGIERLS